MQYLRRNTVMVGLTSSSQTFRQQSLERYTNLAFNYNKESSEQDYQAFIDKTLREEFSKFSKVKALLSQQIELLTL